MLKHQLFGVGSHAAGPVDPLKLQQLPDERGLFPLQQRELFIFLVDFLRQLKILLLQPVDRLRCLLTATGAGRLTLRSLGWLWGLRLVMRVGQRRGSQGEVHVQREATPFPTFGQRHQVAVHLEDAGTLQVEPFLVGVGPGFLWRRGSDSKCD